MSEKPLEGQDGRKELDGASGAGVAVMAYRRRYPTDLSDVEWELVGPLVPPGGRPALRQPPGDR